MKSVLRERQNATSEVCKPATSRGLFLQFDPYKGGERIRKLTEDMTIEEQIEFWRNRDQEFREWQARIKESRR